jgi:SIR2-like domain
VSTEELESHAAIVVKAILEGRVTPFLGAGANLCDRYDGELFEKGKQLPSGGELAAYLASEYRYPYPYSEADLVRVSQYIDNRAGKAHLKAELRTLLLPEFTPSAVHRFLAAIPHMMRVADREPHYQLIVTTNYDDVLEKALTAEGEPFDVVTYLDEKGCFVHWPHGGAATEIEPGTANEYTVAMSEGDDDRLERTVVMKIHGALDRGNPRGDSFVITEDDYIDYLTRADISRIVPVNLVGKLKNSHLLFLGYSLRDWNLRVILHRVWHEQELNDEWVPWAIQWKPEPVEKKFWDRRGVEIIDIKLADYVALLEEEMRTTAVPAAAT